MAFVKANWRNIPITLIVLGGDEPNHYPRTQRITNKMHSERYA